jgi:hypothetical protein
MDLIGIENEAEFFPAGALSDSLQLELREITSRRSKTPDSENPVARLAKCCEPSLAELRRIRNATDSTNRSDWRRRLTHSLVTALGYDLDRRSLQTATRRSKALRHSDERGQNCNRRRPPIFGPGVEQDPGQHCAIIDSPSHKQSEPARP